MRRAYHNTSWRMNGDSFCGVNLGYDFCTEHETGIMGIRNSFGIKSYTGSDFTVSIKKLLNMKPVFGIEARKINQKPPMLQFEQKGSFCAIYYSSKKLTKEFLDDGIKSLSWEMSKPNGKDVISYWGENGFMVMTTDEKRFQVMKKAFNELEICIFANGSNGLVLAVKSMIDDVTKTEMFSSDLNAWEIKTAAAKTGIEKELRRAKMKYYALVPAWKTKTRDQIWFWLNPVEQSRFNSGWYTEDELREWISGKGPVIKTAAKEEPQKIKQNGK